MYFCTLCTHNLVLYAIILHSNNEKHTVPLNQLENLNGLALSKDTTINADDIWMYKGKTPYEATTVGIHTDKGTYLQKLFQFQKNQRRG